MYKTMKVLAIVVLIATILGAGAVLYGIKTLVPIVEQASTAATPAVQAQDVFEDIASQIANETFTGRVFADAQGLSADNCTFLTYTVRLANKGFFPAEWISLDIQPKEGDLLQMDNYKANVLASGSQGDISATILHRGDDVDMQRAFTINCYVFGKKLSLEGIVQ